MAKIPYWENLFPDAANMGVNCNRESARINTATQNIYNHFATNPLNASYGIYSMDVLCNPGCGNGTNTTVTCQPVQQCADHGLDRHHYLQLCAAHPAPPYDVAGCR